MNDNKTQSYKKVERQILRIIESEDFEKDILYARKIIGIPENGARVSKRDKSNIEQPWYIPSALKKKYHEPDNKIEEAIWSITDKYFKELPINDFFISLIVRTYLLYNQIFLKEIWGKTRHLLPIGFCEVRDEHDMMIKLLKYEDFEKHIHAVDNQEISLANHVYVLVQHQHIKQFPISLSIHPDASQRDILDFIKKNWNEIQSLQDKYVDKYKSLRNARVKTNPDIQKRNRIILKNRHLSIKEIRKLLINEGYFLDDGHIGKIISLNRPGGK